MADNQILFPLQISGISGLTLQVVSAPGNTVPSPLAVSEVSGQPGLYAATFTGLGSEEAPIAYSGLLKKDGVLTGYSTLTFLWDGTDFVYPLTVDAIAETRDRILDMNKALGREPGISATVRDATEDEPGSLTTSDGAIDQVLTKNNDGSVTIANAPD